MARSGPNIDNLPCEVLDLIFDEVEANLDPSDGFWIKRAAIETFLACSVQCKLLHYVTLPRIYRHIDLVHYRDDDPTLHDDGHYYAQKCLRFLRSNPRIVNFVRSFSINSSICRQDTTHWVFMNPDLPHILDILSSAGKVEHFAFNGHNQRRVLNWEKFGMKLKNAIFNLCSLPTMSRLDFCGIIELPIDVIFCCKNLTELRMRYGIILSPPDPYDFPVQDSDTISSLKSLEICPKTLYLQRRSADVKIMEQHRLFAGLETLKWMVIDREEFVVRDTGMYIGDHYREHAWDYCLDKVKKTVKVLDVGPSLFGQHADVLSWPAAKTFYAFERLEEIRFRVAITTPSTHSQPQNLSYIVDRFLESPNPIVTIRTVHMQLMLPSDYTSINIPFLRDGWAGIKLDSFLRPTYPNLETLVIEFQRDWRPRTSSVRETPKAEVKELREFMQANLPNVVASTIALKVITPTESFKV